MDFIAEWNVMEWVRKNWLVIILVLVIAYLVYLRNFGVNLLTTANKYGESSGFADLSSPSLGLAPVQDTRTGIMPPIGVEAPPTTGIDRLVVRDTNLSLVVKNVREVLNQIEKKASELGGYMVDSNLNTPEGAASGTIAVRVPEEKRGEALEAFRGYGVKVASEHVSGRDVTDEYVDIEARLAVLRQTKAKFEEILSGASRVEDLLNVQRELVGIQQQMDALVGQQQYLEGSAELSRITVYLSTDELALPYAPDQPWRPAVVWRQAVRSLIMTVRGVGTLLIWAAVYSPLWLPVVGLIWWRKRAGRVNRPVSK